MSRDPCSQGEYTLDEGRVIFFWEIVMGQDKYTKFVLTVIAFSLFWIALNLSVLEFVLYNFYNGEMKKFLSEISNQTAEISSRINEVYSRAAEISSRIDDVSSRADEVIDAIKQR